jgi:hypothetical protein
MYGPLAVYSVALVALGWFLRCIYDWVRRVVRAARRGLDV